MIKLTTTEGVCFEPVELCLPDGSWYLRKTHPNDKGEKQYFIHIIGNGQYYPIDKATYEKWAPNG